jgi:predicted AlkP superfamily phosphohydrolase/phosphomutase
MDLAIEFAKLLIPAALVLYAMYLTINSFLKKEFQKNLLESRMKNNETVLPIRLQAYERISLFLERISPENIVTRLNTQQFTSKEFQTLMIREIREEFNHNLSQQVYMSHELWESIKNTLEQYISLINTTGAEMKEDAKGLDLAKRLFEKMAEKDFNAIEQDQAKLKAEIQQLF